MSSAPFPTPTSTWHDNTYASLSPTRPELSAKGKTVLITGGGTGIGAETAHQFAAAGASRIALLGRREKPLLETKASIEAKFGVGNIEIYIAPTDITKKEEVNAAFKNFVVDGKIDVLVSNACPSGPLKSLKDVDGDEMLESIYESLQGATNVAKALLTYAAPNAVIIDVNSAVAHVSFAPLFAGYAISKMAVYRLWDIVGFDNQGFSVFHVQPGNVDTDLNREAGLVAKLGFEDHVSLPASFHVWLASPEAKFLKGKFLWANWDVDELKAQSKEIETSTRFNIQLVGWPFT